MNNELLKSTCIAIRSVGERTEELCAHLIKSQSLDDDAITIINEKPFSLALKKSYEAGLLKNKAWTLCVDADLLLRPGSIEHFIHIASGVDKAIFEIQGFILDKFFGGPRVGGIHLYRTGLLEKALKVISDDIAGIRPEKQILAKMKDLGYPYLVFPYVIGLHDFEQYYKDIFRKCFVQARKHQEYLDLFVPFWQSKAKEDKDFEIALKGLANGIEYVGDLGIDANNDAVEHYFSKLKITEKRPLPQGSFDLDDIEKIIIAWQEPQEYKKKFPSRAGLDKKLVKMNDRPSHLSNLGRLKSFSYFFGKALLKMGARIERIANSFMNPHIKE